MSSKPNLFYRTLYLIITFIYYVYCKFSKLKLKFGKQLKLNDLIEIRDRKVFSKKNDHIAFIVNYEDNRPLTDNDLIKLISWSVIYRIPYITVYDHDGLLIERRETICRDVLNYLEDNVDLVGKYSIRQGEHKRLFDVKGIQGGYNGKLRFVDKLDGKEKVVKVVKELVHERLAIDNNNVMSDEFELTNPLVLTSKLQEEFKFPDPDMSVICSSIYNMYGYPPWEIRYTEFVLLPDLQDVNIRNFRECLLIFNKKEQRKGR